jgi:hypothetical protein
MNDVAKCITIRTKNRLGELLRRPGGIDREQAIAVALEHVESLRDDYVKAIPGEIEALEAIIAGVGSKEISAREIQELLDCADRLLVLSGTFGYPMLDAVVKRFCDLGIVMIEKGITSVEPLEVHLRAMWLVCPQLSNATDMEARNVLTELSKIHAHFKVA